MSPDDHIYSLSIESVLKAFDASIMVYVAAPLVKRNLLCPFIKP